MLFGALAFAVLLSGPAFAEADPLANAAAWRLGDQLSLAGLLHAQGGQKERVDQLIADMKPLTDAMGIEISPFPPRAANTATAYTDILEYLVKGGGANIGAGLDIRFGPNAAVLFEVSMKSNLLILLYEPGQDRGIGEMIEKRLSELKLPESLWIGLVRAIARKGSEAEVKDAVFKMHDDIADYLQKQVAANPTPRP